MPDQTPGPYAAAATTYHEHGWSPLPLPAGQKHPVPAGWTGNGGAWPSPADVWAWTEDHADGNIALRLPETVIGVDVDHYKDKPGGAVLAHLEQTLGALPATWRTTARDDGVSGIRFYRVPEGLRWPGVLGPGIETLRYGHRYAVAPPSVHPDTGTKYRWYHPDGTVALHQVPAVDDLPDLPAAWVEHFTGGEQATVEARLSDPEAQAWVNRWAGGPQCPRIAHAAADALVAIRGGRGARHDAALSAINRIVWLAGEGHTGAADALGGLRAMFVTNVTERADVDAEFDRMVDGAYRIAAAAHPHIPTTDPCDDPFHGLIDRSETPCSTTSPASPGTAPAPSTGPSAGSPADTSRTPTAGPTAGSAGTDSRTSTSTSYDLAASPGGPSSPAPSAVNSTSPDADDAWEAERARLLLQDQELERLRARRGAQRQLDREDREATIQDRVANLHIQEEAKRVYQREATGAQEAPATVNLTDLLATPDDPVKYRIADLWPAGGRVILAAQAKAGKSTMVTNLVRSLVDGDLFLGAHDVNPPPGRVVIIDNELDPRQIKSNYRAQGIQNTGAVDIIPLRGRVSTFDILDPMIRAEWAERIKGAGVVIFDCLRPLIDSLGLSEDKDAGRVLVAFDALLEDAGVSEGMVVHHMGHSGERSRGDTRIRDWPDAEWKIVKETIEDGVNNDMAARFFSAFGRDVAVPEQELDMTEDKRLFTAGGTRQEAKLRAPLEAVVEVVAGSVGGATGNQIETWLQDSNYSRKAIRDAYKLGVQKGVLEAAPGARRATVYTIGNSTSVLKRQNADPPAANWRTHFANTPVGVGDVANSADYFAGTERRTESTPLCTCGRPVPGGRQLTGNNHCYDCHPPGQRDTPPQGRTRVINGVTYTIDPHTGALL